MKRFLFLLLFVAVIVAYIFELDEVLAKNFKVFANLKTAYINSYISISENIKNHFEQKELIRLLQDENAQLKEYKILYDTTISKINNLKEFVNNVELPSMESKVEIVRVLSYINFDDFTNVWLEKEPEDNNKILGLISENYAAGILLTKQGKSVGLLNGNKDCTYAVFIGNDKSPGIITAANSSDELFVKFIPVWSDIHIGDEVVTSGMDNIFYEGLKVGRVTEIKEFPDMKIATIKPYANPLKKRFFYIYKSTSDFDTNSTEIEKIKNELNN